MIGKSLPDNDYYESLSPELSFVKEAVMPFDKFPLVDPILGPEMKSTGEVMGIGKTFGEAYAKAQLAAKKNVVTSGKVFVSVKESDKKYLQDLIPKLIDSGFSLIATTGTAKTVKDLGFNCEIINKVTEGRPHIVDELVNKKVDIVINTTEGRQSIEDSASIRKTALQNKIFCTTTIFGAFAFVEALKTSREDWSFSAIQEIN